MSATLQWIWKAACLSVKTKYHGEFLHLAIEDKLFRETFLQALIIQ